jgi:hypothetical protein
MFAKSAQPAAYILASSDEVSAQGAGVALPMNFSEAFSTESMGKSPYSVDHDASKVQKKLNR